MAETDDSKDMVNEGYEDDGGTVTEEVEDNGTEEYEVEAGESGSPGQGG